jgi:putative hydrolase of the HAD superfamily
MLEAILFDLDDTLTDWPAALDRALTAGMDALGVPGEPLARRSLWDEITAYTWARRGEMVVDRAYWKLLFEPQVPWERAFPLEPRAAVKAAAAAFRAALEPLPFAEAAPVLDLLAAQGLALGVLSNNPMAAYILKQNGLGPRFRAVVSPDEPYRKPHPQAFISACEAMGAPTAACAYVGDSYQNDVEGAHAAGLTPVWVDRTGDGYAVPAGAHRITALAELPAALSLRAGSSGLP